MVTRIARSYLDDPVNLLHSHVVRGSQVRHPGSWNQGVGSTCLPGVVGKSHDCENGALNEELAGAGKDRGGGD